MVKGQLNGMKLGIWPLIKWNLLGTCRCMAFEKYGRYADDVRYTGAHTMSIVTFEVVDPSLTLITGPR